MDIPEIGFIGHPAEPCVVERDREQLRVKDRIISALCEIAVFFATCRISLFYAEVPDRFNCGYFPK